MDELDDRVKRVVSAPGNHARDEYDRQRSTATVPGQTLPGYDPDEHECFAASVDAAENWGLTRYLWAGHAAGRPTYGVEIRSAVLADGRIVASLCNHLADAREITLRRKKTAVPAQDHLNEEPVHGPVTHAAHETEMAGRATLSGTGVVGAVRVL